MSKKEIYSPISAPELGCYMICVNCRLLGGLPSTNAKVRRYCISVLNDGASPRCGSDPVPDAVAAATHMPAPTSYSYGVVGGDPRYKYLPSIFRFIDGATKSSLVKPWYSTLTSVSSDDRVVTLDRAFKQGRLFTLAGRFYHRRSGGC